VFPILLVFRIGNRRLPFNRPQNQRHENSSIFLAAVIGGGCLVPVAVEVQVLLARSNDFAGLNEEYAKFFPKAPPTRTVARLGPELPNILVSIRMTAVL
jgi:hypothetical protein